MLTCKRPPPEYPIWERNRITFTARDGSTKYVFLKLSKFQPKNFQVESPVHRGLMYDEKTVRFSWLSTNKANILGNTGPLLDLGCLDRSTIHEDNDYHSERR